MDSIKSLRTEYSAHTLDVADLLPSPFAQLEKWMSEAINAKVTEPHAMCLSTVNSEGQPSSRIVLLRSLTAEKLGFFTNYGSQKSKDMEANPNVALNFFWAELERQVRIEGSVKHSNEADSDNYFLSRPRESRIGAWASPQSSRIESRDQLDLLWENTQSLFDDKEVHRPSFWGGFDVYPSRFEFWQGRPSRLHDRLVYSLEESRWNIYRLAP